MNMKSKQFVLACVPIILFFTMYHISRQRALNTLRYREDSAHSAFPTAEQQDKEQPVRMCENDERIAALEDYCRGRSHAQNKNHMTLRQRVHRFLVDDENKVLFCLHAKVGCSTWKTIIVNNTSTQPIPSDAELHIHSDLLQFNISLLDDYKFSDEDIHHRLRTYYKVIVVRHPHDRLHSFFHDKFLQEENDVYRHTMGFHLLSMYHPDLPREVRKQGRASFSDVTRWMQDGAADAHFDGPYMKKCDPCFVKYDYVVKLESNARDAEYVVKQKLKGRGQETSMNVKTEHTKVNPLLTGDGKRIGVFENLTAEQMMFMHDRLAPDLGMFGYTFDETTLQARCLYKDKGCC